MSHVFQLPDEQYSKLITYAAQQNQTPETLFQEWVNEVIHNIQEPTSSSRTKRVGQEGQEGREAETPHSSLSQIFGIFDIGDLNWIDKHDEYLAETYMEDHAEN